MNVYSRNVFVRFDARLISICLYIIKTSELSEENGNTTETTNRGVNKQTQHLCATTAIQLLRCNNKIIIFRQM